MATMNIHHSNYPRILDRKSNHSVGYLKVMCKKSVRLAGGSKSPLKIHLSFANRLPDIPNITMW